MRTGKEYLESLRDNRCIYIGGERVSDVTSHPAFKGITQSIADLYDIAADKKSSMTYQTKDGTVANKIYMIPRSREELTERRQALKKWSESTYGLVGRGPEHVASFFAGFASGLEVFERGGKMFADNVQRFYKYARDNSLYLSYAILPPPTARSKSQNEVDEEFIAAGVYEENKDGIIIRGSQMLGTAATISDYIFVSAIRPLSPGNEKQAFSFVLPVNSPGLKLYARPPYATDKPSVFDYPLSTRFDESDSVVIFEDVFVPWENIFIYKDIETVKDQFFQTPAHKLGNNQAQIRFVTKLKFIIGLAKKITAVNGIDKLPPVQQKLGELASLVSSVEGLLLASEYNCIFDKNGVACPNPRFLYGAIGNQNEIYPKVIHLVRDLVGGSVLQGPSSYKEFLNPETSNDIYKYFGSPDSGAEEKTQLVKLAWEIIGSEFAGRHLQYEMFYVGPDFLCKGYSYRNYGFEEAEQLVEKCLGGYTLPINSDTKVKTE